MAQGQGQLTCKDLDKALAYKRRNFTRQFNSCGEATQFATNNVTVHACDQVKKCQDRFDKAYDELLSTANKICLLYTSPSPRDRQKSRMPSSA